MLPGRKFFYDPNKYGPWKFQVKCVSRYRKMTLKNGNGLGGGRKIKFTGEKTSEFSMGSAYLVTGECGHWQATAEVLI